MANIKFLVRQSSVEQPQTIYVSFRFGRNEKLMYATPLKVSPIFWDAERGRVKNTKYCEDRDELNAALNSIEAMLKKSIDEAAMDGRALTKEGMKSLLDTHFKKSGGVNGFHQFFEHYIDLCATRTNSKRGGQTLSRQTKDGYKRALSCVKEYERLTKTCLDFVSLDQDFYEGFVGFLQSRGLSTNTIGNHIAYLKSVLAAAYERGVNPSFKFKAWHRMSEDGDAIALTEDELKALAEHDFSASPLLEHTRDLFLAGCWTGLRFSDVMRLREENVGERMITIVQKKTDNAVTIPIHPEFRRIWGKYGGHLPMVSSAQRFNVRIKEVCRLVGLNTRVLKSMTKGGKRVTVSLEKWQMVASHTARRTFATILYKSGFPSISIMQITGHKTETAFLKYIKVTKEEHAELLAKHWGQ